jgi:hypothetical protein
MAEDLASVANQVNQGIADPVPEVAAPPSTSVELIRGVFNGATGDWENNAVVREMTGEDEEALAAIDAREDLSYGDYLYHLLQRCVVSIGSQEISKVPHIIDDLLIGDRDLLFLAIVRATYGISRKIEMICGGCREHNDVTLRLDDDFPVSDVEVDTTKKISVKLKNGSTVEFNYPTAGDSRYALKKAKTTAEQNTLIIARCADVSMDRISRENWAKKLNISDRSNIVKALTSTQPGPRMEEVKTQCAHCNAEMVVAVDWVSLLFG